MTTLAAVRTELFDTLDALAVAQTYRWRLGDYQYPAFIVGYPESIDVRPAMGDLRDFVIDVFVAVELTDDPSCDERLSELLEAAVTALQENPAWDVRPATDFGVEQSLDGRASITCRIPVAVFS